MVEKLKLQDFDILGILELKDIQGIEKFVTPIKDEEGRTKSYLSRSKEYYNVKTMSELAICREELQHLLTRECSKRNFVILENMLNCSGKVYFKNFEKYIKYKVQGKDTRNQLIQLIQAQKCLEEDIRNILILLQGNNCIEVDLGNRLPGGDENSEQRPIEMDNKAILYMFAKSLSQAKDPDKVEVVTPGYGGIYIGPMLKAMYGYDYTILLKSKYVEEATKLDHVDVRELTSSQRPFEEGKKVLLLDDNVGTGATLKETKEALVNAGIRNIKMGAVQFNWRNYYRVSVGEKKDIDRFETSDFDIITPINYAGHKLYRNAKNLLLSSGGADYIKYLESKAYRKEFCDLQGAVRRGILCARPTGLELDPEHKTTNQTNLAEDCVILEKYQNSPKTIQNKFARNLIDRIIDETEQLGKNLEIPKSKENLQDEQ